LTSEGKATIFGAGLWLGLRDRPQKKKKRKRTV